MSLTTVDPGLLSSGSQYNQFKNRIINGAMMIDQRNAGAAISTHNAFPVDRMQMTNQMTSGVYSAGRSTDAPTGQFTNSLVCTVTTAQASIAVTGDYAAIRQKIEGYNMVGLGQGTASPSTFTLSFWVKATQTGTWCVQFTNGAGRFYLSTYTVNSASTWEYKTITVTGDSSGTWDTTNGIGLQVWWTLACGTDYQTATTNTWVTSATSLMKTSAANNFFATVGNTWQITGVQLEKGSTATSFDYRPYGTELALCQRYFIKYENSGSNSFIMSGFGSAGSATSGSATITMPVTMRSQPSFASANIAAADGVNPVTFITSTSIRTDVSTTSQVIWEYVVASGLTQYRPYYVRSQTSASAYISLSAEL